MSKIALLCVLAVSTSLFAVPPNPNDYNVTIQVRCNRLRFSHQGPYQQLGVLIEGKSYEFMGEADDGMLGLGSYQARRIDLHEKQPSNFNVKMEYEILLPSKKTWKVVLSGFGYDPCRANN